MPDKRSSSSSIEAIKDLLEYYPDDVLLLLTLGRRFMDIDNFVEAEQTFLKAIDLDPSYSVTYRYLGEAHEKSGNPSKASEIYKRGIKIAREQGDLQVAKEMEVFLKRLSRKGG